MLHRVCSVLVPAYACDVLIVAPAIDAEQLNQMVNLFCSLLKQVNYAGFGLEKNSISTKTTSLFSYSDLSDPGHTMWSKFLEMSAKYKLAPAAVDLH
jgi:hypothetical protein